VKNVLCLVPVRNGARDLNMCLSSLSRLAHGVVALDDGSIDDTFEILHRHPIVRRVLRNPRRVSYKGWDDAANRARLLEAAAEFSPYWIFWIDADEVLPEDDAKHLSAFLEHEAVPEAAYALEVYRMIGDMDHFDRCALWVYRIFAFRKNLQLATKRFHFEPVPTAIDRTRWMRTRFRLKHRASLTEADRWARYAKYEEVDPTRKWQASYENLLDPPREVKQFPAFDPGADVLIDRDPPNPLHKVWRNLSRRLSHKLRNITPGSSWLRKG
jgi:glycosyltransferase involved in cell wall biosynthesis